jgi:hypothetical protein
MEHESPTPQPPALIPSRQVNGWTIERQRAFLEMLAQCGIVERAAGMVGMTRQSAYAFRHTIAGHAFNLAWDAALLLVRRRMIDEAFELSFEGSVEQIFRDGILVQEKRKRDPQMLLAMIERLGKSDAIGSIPAHAVAEEFSAFLDAMAADANGESGGTGNFMQSRADADRTDRQFELSESSEVLHRAALNAKRATPRLADGRQS